MYKSALYDGGTLTAVPTLYKNPSVPFRPFRPFRSVRPLHLQYTPLAVSVQPLIVRQISTNAGKPHEY